MIEIPKILIEDIKHGNLVLFVGSGLSNNANLPTWNTLIETLTKKLCQLSKEENTFFENLNNLEKVEFLLDRVSRSKLLDSTKNLFNKKIDYKNSQIHKLLIGLPINLIITTNWDDLIEKYYHKQTDKNCNVIYSDKQLQSMNPNGLNIIKFHGSIENPQSIIFSESDYYSNAIENSLLKNYLIGQLSNKSVLFIGYSLKDFNFKLLLHTIDEKLQGFQGTKYYFLPKENKVEEEYLKNRGLTIIPYNEKTYKESTLKFLSDLSKHVTNKAQNSKDRMMLLYREVSNVSTNPKNLIIRNMSNLGPLATPLVNTGKPTFGSKEITSLEISCSKKWINLIKKGAKSKMILCLDEKWLTFNYNNKTLLKRLITLRSNLVEFEHKIDVVDYGRITNRNYDIYGDETCIISNKIKYKLKSYNDCNVIWDRIKVEEEVLKFDSLFDDIQKSNTREAKKSKLTLHHFILNKIDEIIKNIS